MCSCTDTKPHANTVYFKLSTCQTARCGFTQTSWRKVLFIILHLVPLKNTQKHLPPQCWEPDLDGMYSYFESPQCSHRVCHGRVVRHAKWGAHYLLRWGLIGAVKEKGQGESLAQNILAVCRWSCYWKEMCTEAKSCERTQTITQKKTKHKRKRLADKMFCVPFYRLHRIQHKHAHSSCCY